MNLIKTLLSVVAYSVLISPVFAQAKSATKAASKSSSGPSSKIDVVSDAEIALLKTLDTTYQHKSATMKIERVTKMPLLEQEHKANGKLWISGGKLRMELDGEEKTLLVVNKKTLWAVTYPPAEFRDGPVQVYKADSSTKKGQSKNLISLISQGGFLKFFLPTGVEKQANGDVLFFLTPLKDQTDFKRAQVKISSDGKKLLALNYWDDRENEVRMQFKDVKFEKTLDEKLFNYAPPANAQQMNL
jgi:outer membrane lipoprotein-sorting protein